MPVRIPAATRTEVFCMGAGGISAFAPFYLMAPGAEERLARQTTKWAPKWERNITMFKNPVERGVQRMSPPVARTVQRVERNLHLEQAAQRTDRGIKKSLDKMNIKKIDMTLT
ncbi:hypothetical protein QBC35DRAFT_148682 [Podospora australis]|uniref:Uncharacterized protein n=1 Tax=Podospora australis TaxID=1536484 RepID=A0AAN7AJA2_9PEZI|nr:hypothetical protein QBC35DRAFT_148682 [Podospora australis]